MFVGTLIELLKKPAHLVSSRFTKVGLRPGNLLRDRYRVIQVLSRGGWGETYIARDLDRPGIPRCVIKILKPSTEDQSSLDIAEDLFGREAETLERLGQHRQIPMLLAYFQTNSNFCLVQEFIDGFPLDTELSPGLQWSKSKVVSLLIEVLDILTFVHAQKVIHRDIKPSNLIRRRYDGRLVLIDFGAVKQIRESGGFTQAQADPLTVSIGTRGYMPLEQFAGRPRLSSDVYALGIICVQAMTGIEAENLPRNNDDEVVWRGHTRETGPIVEIVDKMVRSRYGDRYQSSEEVLKDIEKVFPDKIADHKAASSLNRQPPKEDSFQQEDSLIIKKYSRRPPVTSLALGAGASLLLLVPILLNSRQIQNFKDYASLTASLKSQDWEAADQRTFDLLLGLVGNESKERRKFVSKEWEQFVNNQENCRHIKRIDSLWSEASNGELGFSAQQRLFESLASEDGSVDISSFYKQVKWVSNDSKKLFVRWVYDEDALDTYYTEGQTPNYSQPSTGHLPAIMSWGNSIDGKPSGDKRFFLFNLCGI